MPSSTIPAGQDDLLRRVRAGFLIQGTTLAAWCKGADVRHSYAYKVLRFETNGPAAVALRERMTAAATMAA